MRRLLLLLSAPLLWLFAFSAPAHAQGQVYTPGDVTSVQLAGPYSPAATCQKGACAFTLGDQPQVVSTTSSPITDQALNSNTNVVLFTGAATLTVNSFAGPANGRVIEVINNTGNALTFAYDTGATTANRIYTLSGASESIANRGVALLVYSTSSSRWHLFAPAAGSGFTLATGEVVQINSGTTTVTDYAVNATTTVIKFTGAGSFSITGFTGGADGRILKLVNATGNALTFSHDATSTAANRIYTSSGASEAWPINAVKYLIYSSSSSRWILEATPSGTTYTATSPLALVGSAFGMANGTRGDITTTTGTNPGDTWTINSAAVTLAKMADLAQATIIGRAAGAGTGVPTALSQTQLTALVNTFTSALSGVVPASGGGTANFIRADGTWAVPPGTATGTITQVVTSGPGVNQATCSSGSCSVTLSDPVVTIGATGTVTLGAADTVVEITTAGVVLQGITGGANGRTVKITNTSAASVTLAYENVTATAANRISASGGLDYTLLSKTSVTATYSTTSSRWLLNGFANSGGPCSAGQHVSGVTAVGTVTCSADAGLTVVQSVSVTGTQNDYASINSTTTVLRVTGTSSPRFNGFTGGTSGRGLWLYNVGGTSITFSHEDAGSTAANRITMTAGIGNLSDLVASCGIHFTYDGTTSRWLQDTLSCYHLPGAIMDQPLTVNAAFSANAGSTLNGTATNTSVFSTNTTVNAGGATGVLALGSAATGGVNIGNSGNLVSIQAPLYINPSYGYRFHDDFEDCPTAINTSLSINQWVYGTTTNSGFVADNTPGGGSGWCKVSLGSAAGTGNESARANGGFGAAAGSGLTRYYAGSGTLVFESLVKTGATLCDAATDPCKFYDGFTNTNTAAFSTGIGFAFESATSSGFWRIYACSVAFGCTNTTTSIAIAANTTYKLAFTCTAAGSCSYTINGAAAGTIATTSVPTGTGNGFSPAVMAFKTVGSGVRDMYVDYLDFYQVFTTPR